MTQEERDGLRQSLMAAVPLTEAQCLALLDEVEQRRQERRRFQPASAIEEPAAPAPRPYWYDRVRVEQQRQDQQRDPQDDDDGGWAMALMGEVGELCQAAREGRTYRLQEELVQAATVIMSWLEATGRR